MHKVLCNSKLALPMFSSHSAPFLCCVVGCRNNVSVGFLPSLNEIFYKLKKTLDEEEGEGRTASESTSNLSVTGIMTHVGHRGDPTILNYKTSTTFLQLHANFLRGLQILNIT